MSFRGSFPFSLLSPWSCVQEPVCCAVFVSDSAVDLWEALFIVLLFYPPWNVLHSWRLGTHGWYTPNSLWQPRMPVHFQRSSGRWSQWGSLNCLWSAHSCIIACSLVFTKLQPQLVLFLPHPQSQSENVMGYPVGTVLETPRPWCCLCEVGLCWQLSMLAWETECMGSYSISATYLLCDLGQLPNLSFSIFKRGILLFLSYRTVAGISLCKLLHRLFDSYFVLNNCLAIIFFYDHQWYTSDKG